MDAATLEALGRLSAAALLVAAVLGLVFGYVLPRGTVRERDAAANARLDEMRVDRDAWKAIATSALGRLDRLTDVVETLSGKKLS